MEIWLCREFADAGRTGCGGFLDIGGSAPNRAAKRIPTTSDALQDLGDRGDGVPVPRRGRLSEEAVQRAEIADRLHVATVLTDDEPAIAREDSQQPLALRWKRERQLWLKARHSRENTDEANDVRTAWLAAEPVLSEQSVDPAARANHDGGFEWQPSCQLNAQSPLRDRLPDDEGTRRADVDGVQMLQLFREPGRPEGSVPANVDAAQKNDVAHDGIRLNLRLAVTFPAVRLNSLQSTSTMNTRRACALTLRLSTLVFMTSFVAACQRAPAPAPVPPPRDEKAATTL